VSDESTLRKAVTAALVFLENAVVTERAVALRDVAGARPLITSLRAALAAPSAATGSGDAASRDAVAEVLAPLVAKARRPVPKMDGSHNPNPADLAIAREMADAVLPRWRDAAPRGEAVAWCIMHKNGRILGNKTWPNRDDAERELASCRLLLSITTEASGYRVVALVPRESPSEEPTP
jgi:hypothetical protein